MRATAAAVLRIGALALVLVRCMQLARGISVNGIRCTPFATLDGPCPEPGACLANSAVPCVTWEVTSFTLDPAADAEQHRKRSSRCPTFDGGGGHFVNDMWALDNSSACNLEHAWLSPDQLHFRLKHRHIAISGDSMQRQLFMRMVWYLRGFTHVVEHFFHRDAIFIRNATHDLFWTSWSEHFEPHQISYHYHRHEQLPYRVDVMQNDHPSRHGHIENPLLIVQFVWDTSESRTSYQDVKDAFRSSGTMHAVYVPGIHYWRKEDCINTSGVQSLQVISQDGRPIRRTAIYYVTTAESTAGADQAAQQRRNTHFRASAPRFLGRILPMDKMAAAGHFRNTDGLHYGCKYDRDSWKNVTVADFKEPPGWHQLGGADCRDLMNLNLVQMIASTCC